LVAKIRIGFTGKRYEHFIAVCSDNHVVAISKFATFNVWSVIVVAGVIVIVIGGVFVVVIVVVIVAAGAQRDRRGQRQNQKREQQENPFVRFM
jgi:Flp pilus assembly protein TadB